ncbi:unnamed protein product, partial [Mesorhabditis belari]|uniref:SH3 domain-containing protein n=1 Tax=Mesorhabditis belari TaxID=2138241 RepID=A0AAF3FCS0_9BILA
MSLKVGQLVTFRREIDANWMEGANNLGEMGIFPSFYVRRFSTRCFDHDAITMRSIFIIIIPVFIRRLISLVHHIINKKRHLS